MWHYGQVKGADATPVFVIRARRVNKSLLYVNICMSTSVPLNPAGVITTNSTSRLNFGFDGAVDKLRHSYTYAQARAEEETRVAQILKLQRCVAAEEKRLREIEEAKRVRVLLEGTSDDESIDDSELEDDVLGSVASYRLDAFVYYYSN